jgi:hypothetical protein
MITRFSTLYVCHIELEDCGLAGAFADSRRAGARCIIRLASSPTGQRETPRSLP